ncbi:MAG: MFS transporter [Spirulina sp. SIO3F2]|nr:MFS transporter [Spirulina sp. SIO3F2]
MPRWDTDDWLTPAEPMEQSLSDIADALDSAPPETNQGFGPVLHNPRFLVLWGGQIFSQLADKVYLVMMIALISQVFQVSDEAIGRWVSAVMIAFTIPAVLFGSLAGVYVDRWLKKDVLVGTNLVRGAFVLLIPLLLAVNQAAGSLFGVPGGFIALLLVTFGVSTLTQFFAPAEQAVIPLIVPRQHLLPANSLYTTTMMALLIVGFALGEPLLSWCDRALFSLNPNWTFGSELLVGGAYGLAGLLLLLLRTGERSQPTTEQQPHVWQDIWDGVRYLQKQPRVRNALIQLVILFCVFAALAVLAVPLAAELPQLKPEQFGVLLAAGGIGMGLGAVLVGSWGQNLPTLVLTRGGLIGVAASLGGLALVTQQLWGAIALISLLGFFAAGVGIPMQTTIQAETPESMRGKVFGLQNNAVNIALSLPLALAGIAQSVWGLSTVLVILSGTVLVGGLGSSLISEVGVVTSSNIKKR